MLTLLLALATLFQRWTSHDGDGGDGHDLDGDDEGLGDKGVAALRKERAIRKAAEKEARAAARAREKLEAELADIRSQQQSEDEKRMEAALVEARKQAEAEARAKYVGRAISAEVRAAAAGKGFITPEDAERLLDLDSEDLDPDADDFRGTIAAALDALAEERPYLVGEGKQKVTGEGDGGAKPKASTAADNISPAERLRRAYAGKK